MEWKSETKLSARKCMIECWADKNRTEKDYIECYFLGFGIDYNDITEGHYNIAIVEFNDGTIDTVTLDKIRFIDREYK